MAPHVSLSSRKSCEHVWLDRGVRGIVEGTELSEHLGCALALVFSGSQAHCEVLKTLGLFADGTSLVQRLSPPLPHLSQLGNFGKNTDVGPVHKTADWNVGESWLKYLFKDDSTEQSQS